MSAERLREAVSVLRERAEAIREWNLDDGHLWITEHDPSDPTGETPMQVLVGGAEEPWASYIALMSPPVALALADLLDNTGRVIQNTGRDWPGTFEGEKAVADAILGATS